MDSVKLIMGDTDLTPFDAGTFGSQSTPRMSPQLRKAGAAAREMLLDLAAEQWKVDRGALSIREGKVTAGSRSAGFGELTHGQQLTRTISAAALTPASEWTVMGASDAEGGRPRHRHRTSSIHRRPQTSRHAPRKSAAPSGVRSDARVGGHLRRRGHPRCQGGARRQLRRRRRARRVDCRARACRAQARVDTRAHAAFEPGTLRLSPRAMHLHAAQAAAGLHRRPTSRTRRSSRARLSRNSRTANSPSGPARSVPLA